MDFESLPTQVHLPLLGKRGLEEVDVLIEIDGDWKKLEAPTSVTKDDIEAEAGSQPRWTL